MTLFERYCALHGHQPFGASPAIVAQFATDIAPMGIEHVWEALRDVSRMHYTHGFPDPTLGPTVATALNNIVRVDFPRSWPKELRERFEMLPHEIRHWLATRQTADDALIRKLQNELAQLKKDNTNGTHSAETPHQSAA
jgi:hypothetical protein